MIKRILRHQDGLLTLSFLLLAIVFSVAIGYLKVDALHAWRYTSDLFSYDTILQETLRGHLGLEFTYGNTFGDHAYIFLLLLLPLKLLLQNRMVELLVWLCPAAGLLSAVVLFFAVRDLKGSLTAIWIAGASLLTFGLAYRGIYENIYGFHPDTLSGYLAVGFSACLIWHNARREIQRHSALQLVFFWIFFLLFISLKEEMALLGILFFLICVFFERNSLHLTALGLAIAATAAEFTFIKFSQTEFNRTNEALFSSLLNVIRSKGLTFFFLKPFTSGQLAMVSYWPLCLSCVVAFILLYKYSLKKNYYALALFAIGLIKLLFSLSVPDFDLTKWHNFPGVVMLLAGLLWQLSYMDRGRALIRQGLPALIFLVSLIGFCVISLPFFHQTLQVDLRRRNQIVVYEKEIAILQTFIDRERIVAIPQLSVFAWTGFRYTFYPHGLTMSPQGIADYAIYPVKLPESYVWTLVDALPLSKLKGYFEVVTVTPHFILLRRTAVTETQRASREQFFQLFPIFPDSLPR